MQKLLLLVVFWGNCLLSLGQKTSGAGQVSSSAGGVVFHSSDTALARAFSWAKEMALHYRGKPGDPVGPWYESALPPRDAFCMRDASHQCIGAEILGLHRENQNMFSKFTSNISVARDWCSYWEMDKEDRPSPSDYRNDSAFWYNLNANFDVMDACWRVYLWTGDTLYLKNAAFRNFYDRSANEFIMKWILEPDSLLSRPAYPNAPIPFNIEDAFHRCRGLPSYSEGVPNLKMGVDLIAAIYRGLSSYAAMYPGNERYLAKADAYRQRIDADWWDPRAGLYHTHYTNDRAFGKAEGETFLLWFDAIKDSVRRVKTINHLLTLDLNVENLSYLPLQYYRNGYTNEARALILHLADPATKRREYPEVSFGMVEAIVQGLMGVEADARRHMVCTRYRGVGRSALFNLPVLNTTVSLVHYGGGKSILKNTGGVSIRWRCEKESRGRIVSFKEVDLAPGQQKIIQL